jgi:hypothetical protein
VPSDFGRPSTFGQEQQQYGGQEQQQYGQYGQQYEQSAGGAQRFGGQQPGDQHGARQPGLRQSGGQPGYEQPGQFGGQSYPGQPGVGQPSAGQPQYREERVAAGVAAGGSSRPRSPLADDSDEISDDPMEAFSRRWARRGSDDGGAPPRRRMWLIGGGGVIVVALAAVAYFLIGGNTGSSTLGFGSLVTTFLPGEIQKVPDACKAVSPATLSQYLPGGQPEIAAPPLNGGADSQCTWTLDSPPTYRVIEAEISAFSPSGLASGDGSATFAAIDAYASDLDTLKSPASNSGQPKAVISDISGLGSAAFSALQTFNTNGTTTYKATVIVRYHNVLVTVVVNGLQHAVTSKGRYGPVAMTTLSAAAHQVAIEAVAQLHA